MSLLEQINELNKRDNDLVNCNSEIVINTIFSSLKKQLFDLILEKYKSQHVYGYIWSKIPDDWHDTREKFIENFNGTLWGGPHQYYDWVVSNKFETNRTDDDIIELSFRVPKGPISGNYEGSIHPLKWRAKRFPSEYSAVYKYKDHIFMSPFPLWKPDEDDSKFKTSGVMIEFSSCELFYQNIKELLDKALSKEGFNNYSLEIQSAYDVVRLPKCEYKSLFSSRLIVTDEWYTIQNYDGKILWFDIHW